MKKHFLFPLMAAMLALTLVLGACGGAAPAPAPAEPAPAAPAPAAPAETPAPAADEKIEMTMGSWRTDDVVQVTALLAEYTALNPNVTIKFQPINPPDYNATIRLQLESGTGPDLLYSRSFATGEELYTAGFVADVSDIPGLQENYDDVARAPWIASDGKNFAIPVAAVSQPVFYNKDLFKANGLEIPTTWDDFIKACDTLKAAGITPIANGIADEWDILECLFSAMIPNYIGGAEERVKYESGEKKLNDEAFVQAYTDVASLAKYLPDGFEAVGYNDSAALFSTQGAAMFFDGSWSLGIYDDVTFDWGTFSVPARDASKSMVCFHPDMAWTMNAASKHPEEARAFLSWICSRESSQPVSNALPTGFFPIINFSTTLPDAHATECLALRDGKKTDMRFMWPTPELYAPMLQAVNNVLKGTMTPQEAADSVAAVK